MMSRNAANGSPETRSLSHGDSPATAQLVDPISTAINIPGKITSSNDEPEFLLLNETMLSNQTAYRRSEAYISMQLPGEVFEETAEVANFRLLLSKYRLLMVGNDNFVCSIPLLMIETIEVRDNAFVMICRDGRHIQVPIAEKEILYVWTKKLMKTSQQRAHTDIFALHFYAAVSNPQTAPVWLRRTVAIRTALQRLEADFKRFELLRFRISSANVDFKVCESYPQHLIVPECLSDEELIKLREARTANRIPTVAWAHRGRTLIRASQPVHTLWNGFQVNFNDIAIMAKYQEALQEKSDSYNGIVLFMGMANIHNIRQSFASLRVALNSADTNLFLQNLQATNWFQHILLTFGVADEVLNMMLSGRSVLVHCTDGWDRTSQICTLCMLIGDPYYRTFDGFESLIQRQWVEFGHKFGDRSSTLNVSMNANEVSPIFLQFLDCVHQLWNRNPDAFEFNRRYLVKLSQHVYSGLFSTFLFNNLKEAAACGCAQTHEADGSLSYVEQKAFPIWAYLGRHNTEFVNPLFREPIDGVPSRLSVPTTIKDLDLWRDAYCCTAAQQFLNKMDCPQTIGKNPLDVENLTTNSQVNNNTNGDLVNGSGVNTTIFAIGSPSPLGNSTKHNVSAPLHPSTSQKTGVEQQVSPTKLPNGGMWNDDILSGLTSQVESIILNKIPIDMTNPVVEEGAKRITKSCVQDPMHAVIFTSQHSINGVLLSSSSNVSSLKSQTSDNYRLRTSSESCKFIGKRANGLANHAMEFVNEVRRSLDVDGLCRIPIPMEDQMVEMFTAFKLNSRCLHPAIPLAPFHENSSNLPHSEKTFINGNGNSPLNLPVYPTTAAYSIFNGTVMTNGGRLYYTTTASTSTAPLLEHQSFAGTHMMNSNSNRRVRNESLDSMHAVGFEFIDEVEPHFNGINSQRRKHDSSGSLSQSYGQSPGLNFTSFTMDGVPQPRNQRHSTPVNERSEDELSIVQPAAVDQFDSVSNGSSSLERGTLFRSSAASMTSLQAIRASHTSASMSASRSELNGIANGKGAFASPVKNTPGKLFNGGNLSGSANSLDETMRSKGQTVAG